MPDTTHSPDVAAALSGWIHRLSQLRDDVDIFRLDRRGIAAQIRDIVDDMQQARKRVEQ